MKSITTNIKRLSLLLVGMAVLLSSCTHEERILEKPSGNDEVRFSLELPNSTRVQTRSTTPGTPEENAVKSLYLLVCEPDGGDLIEVVACRNLTAKPGTDQKEWTFSAKLTKDSSYDLILAANAGSKVSALSAGDTRAEVIAALEVENTSKWAVDGTTEAKSIPMYGILSDQAVTDSYSPEKFNLTRMLAKVNVSLASGVGNFEITKIYYYNYHTRGFVIPNLDEDDETVYPSSGLQVGYDKTTMLYTGTEITGGESCLEQIYAFEAPHVAAYGEPGWTQNPCLVIGGKYGNGGETFYRLDFIKKGSPDEWLSIRRNHNYIMTINSVSGAGYGSEEQAYNSAPVNMEADVNEWDDGEVSEIVIDGPYMFGVNKTAFTLLVDGMNSEEQSNKLVVSTTYTNPVAGEEGQNWKAEFSSSDTEVVPVASEKIWVGFGAGKAQSATGEGDSDANYLYYTQNTTQFPRPAYIHVTSGKMKIVITITQPVRGVLSLEIVDPISGQSLNGKTLTFYENGTVSQHDPKYFTLRWSPKSEEVNVEIVSLDKNNKVQWTFDEARGSASETALKTLNGTGSQMFTVFPKPFGAGEESDKLAQRGRLLIYSIGEGDDMISATVMLAQAQFNSMTVDSKSSYLYGGGPYTINVKSTFDWVISDITESTGRGQTINILPGNGDIYDLLDNATTVPANSETGTDITFRVKSALATPAGEVSIQFTDPNNLGRFKIITFKVVGGTHYSSHGGWAGSNVYWDGIRLTFADTGTTDKQNYQGVFFKWGSLVGMQPNASWSTSRTVYAPTEWSKRGLVNISGYTWDQIPFIETLPSSDLQFAKTEYVMKEVHNPANGTGDICKYITEKGWAPGGVQWRMPTIAEMGTSSNYIKFEGWSSSATNTTNANGTGIISNYYTKKADAASNRTTANFTAGGFLSSSGPFNVGSYGYYWSSSAGSATTFYDMIFSGSSMNMGSPARALSAKPVRCVREK